MPPRTSCVMNRMSNSQQIAMLSTAPSSMTYHIDGGSDECTEKSRIRRHSRKWLNCRRASAWTISSAGVRGWNSSSFSWKAWARIVPSSGVMPCCWSGQA